MSLMNKYLEPKALRIMELLAQKRSANFIVHLLDVPFSEVLRIWKTKRFKAKKDDFDVEVLVQLSTK